jgi:RNA polymerase sigma factor (sigma-70 family)
VTDDEESPTGAWAWDEIRAEMTKVIGSRLPAADLRDAVQEACARIVKAAKGATIRDPLLYARQVAENVVIDSHKERLRRRRLDFIYLADRESRCDAEDLCTPERVSEAESELQWMTRAFNELPPNKQAVCIKKLAGVPPNEIAKQLGMSQSTVYRYIGDIYERFWKARQASERGRKDDK